MATRGNIGNLLVMPLRSQTGAMVPLGELGRFVNKPVDPVIYHKDLRALEYVTATWSAGSARRSMACSMSTSR